MKEDSISFERRVFVLGGVQFLALGTLLSRLGTLQIKEHETFHLMSQENCRRLRKLPAPRAKILDANGVILADTLPGFRAVYYAQDIPKADRPQALKKAVEAIGFSKDPFKSLEHQPATLPLVLQEDLTWQEVVRLEMMQLPGLHIQETAHRSYPLGSLFSHVLGYVGKPTAEDLEEHPDLRSLSVKVGRQGVEKLKDQDLQGVPGLQELEVNALGQTLRTLSSIPPVQAPPLETTFCTAVQQSLVQALEEHPAGAGVVLDIKTGGIIALGSHPSFDPTLFLTSLSQKNWDHLNNNPLRPLFNRPTNGLYAPGSLLKPIFALAGLESGVITPQTKVSCHGWTELNNHRFHCLSVHGSVSVKEAIAFSCNCFFYELAQKLGPKILEETLHRFGFGKSYGLLPSEKAGLVPNPAWKQQKYHQKWMVGDTLNMVIGQGFVLASPLQLAVMTATIANGGALQTPTFYPSLRSGYSLNLDPEALQVIQDAMRAVCTYGSAHRLCTGSMIAGKTGTAQVRRISRQEREKGTRLPYNWLREDHALFVGYAPFDDPRYACCILVDHGGLGGRTAVPIGRKVLEAALT